MSLQEQLENLTDIKDKCSTIAAYLKTVNPARCSSMAVWQSGGRFLCQAHVNGEFYGHVMVVDVENENLCPI